MEKRKLLSFRGQRGSTWIMESPKLFLTLKGSVRHLNMRDINCQHMLPVKAKWVSRVRS